MRALLPLIILLLVPGTVPGASMMLRANGYSLVAIHRESVPEAARSTAQIGGDQQPETALVSAGEQPILPASPLVGSVEPRAGPTA